MIRRTLRVVTEHIDGQDVAVFVGLALVSTGVALIHPPSAFIVGGGGVLGLAIFGRRLLR